jgi:hypothetical protein
MKENADPNGHIKQYLSQYIALGHPPYFAVMLTGAWGIGKTFLVKQFLKGALKEDQKLAYVSLYGLRSSDEIDGALFRAIYPILDSAGVRIMGRLARTAARFFRVDPEMQTSDVLNKYNATLFVFDDLERCEMPINEVLGYINEFVEHEGCKVIIIANEEEIKQEEGYRKRREKLVGKTLQVQSVFEEALSSFISLVSDSDIKNVLQKHVQDIASVYHQSELNNLRILQQTIWDFERFSTALLESQRENDEAMSALIKFMFAISFELKGGRIQASDLKNRVNSIVAGIMKKNKEETPTGLALSSKRYPNIMLHDTILSDEVLADILDKGIVDEEKIRLCLSKSHYFAEFIDEPAWTTVWHWLERTDAEFMTAQTVMERQFSQREIVETGALLHIFGLRLMLSDMKILDKDRAEIVRECKAYIDDLYDQNRLLLLNRDERGSGLRFDGYGGLGISESSTAEYRELFQYVEQKRKQASEAELPKQGIDLLAEMEADPELYFRRLNYSNSDDNLYPDVPILAAISPAAFADAFMKLSPIKQRTVMTTFKGRYERGGLSNDLASEKPWLASLKIELVARAAPLPRIGQERMNKVIEWYIDPRLVA